MVCDHLAEAIPTDPQTALPRLGVDVGSMSTLTMIEPLTTTEAGIEWVRQEGLVHPCGYETFRGSRENFEPPEYCENDTADDEEFCPGHTEGDEPEPVERYDDEYGRFNECYEFTEDCD